MRFLREVNTHSSAFSILDHLHVQISFGQSAERNGILDGDRSAVGLIDGADDLRMTEALRGVPDVCPGASELVVRLHDVSEAGGEFSHGKLDRHRAGGGGCLCRSYLR